MAGSGWCWSIRSGAQTFNKLTFALPAAVKTALEGSYSDLRLRIVLNTPNTSSPLLLDNLDIGNAGDGVPPDTTLNLTYPKRQSLSSVFLSASNRLQVDDRVTLAQAGEGALLAGLGSEGVEVGAGARVYGNLYGGGSVLLRSSLMCTDPSLRPAPSRSNRRTSPSMGPPSKTRPCRPPL